MYAKLQTNKRALILAAYKTVGPTFTYHGFHMSSSTGSFRGMVWSNKKQLFETALHWLPSKSKLSFSFFFFLVWKLLRVIFPWPPSCFVSCFGPNLSPCRLLVTHIMQISEITQHAFTCPGSVIKWVANIPTLIIKESLFFCLLTFYTEF